MKKFYIFLCIAIASLTQLQAQAPQGFNYQATVRNSSGDLIVNTNVYFKFNVIQGSQTAVPIFTETHYVPTDDLGQVNLVIGQGTANTGTFSALDWSLGSYYLGIELDTGSGYVAMGTTQLLSVPYALYAENSGNATSATPNLEAVLAENNSANSQQIKDLQDPTDAQDAVTKNYVDTEVSNNVQNIEQVLTQGNDANGIQLKGIADPTEAQDAVTKAYLENNTTSSGLTPGNTLGDMLYWDGENWTQINAPENNGTLRFCDGQLTWGACKAEIRVHDIIGGNYIRYSIETNGSDVYDIRAYISQENSVPDENDTTFLGWPNDNLGTVYLYHVQDEIYLNDFLNTNTTYYIILRVESSLGISYSEVVQFSFTESDIDNDYDGYTENQGDCDDTNASINPGATEIEDGIDNDCDGEIDEGFSNNSDIDMTNGTFTQCEGVLYDSGGELNNYSGNEDYTLTICPDGSGTSTVLEFISFVTQASVDVLTIFNGTTTSDPILGTYSGTQTLGTITADNTSGCLTLRFVSNGGVNTAGFAANISCDFFGTVTDIDGNTYDYLTYGNQVWTVDNAEMVTYRDGTPIPQVTDNTEWQNLTTGAWAYYNNDPTKPRLYNWYAVMGIHDTDPNTPNKEFAPEGWHVPSDAEWTTLENYLIANGYNYDGTTTENKIAKAMASTTGWISYDTTGVPGNDQSLNNSSGFNAFPEGFRSASSGSFGNEGYDAVFWSSTEGNTSDAWSRNVNYGNSYLNRYSLSEQNGFSVRFVRD